MQVTALLAVVLGVNCGPLRISFFFPENVDDGVFMV